MKNRIKFPKESDTFLLEVQARVNKYMVDNAISKYGDSTILYKNSILLLIFASFYTLLFYTPSTIVAFICFAVFGPLFIIIAINIAHDAVHGVACSNKSINDWLMLQMDLFGANSYTWKARHKQGHHSFPNILGHDPDLNPTTIVKIFPNSIKLPIHAYQHLYIPVLYAFYSINWIFIRDFKDFFA